MKQTQRRQMPELQLKSPRNKYSLEKQSSRSKITKTNESEHMQATKSFPSFLKIDSPRFPYNINKSQHLSKFKFHELYHDKKLKTLSSILTKQKSLNIQSNKNKTEKSIYEEEQLLFEDKMHIVSNLTNYFPGETHQNQSNFITDPKQDSIVQHQRKNFDLSLMVKKKELSTLPSPDILPTPNKLPKCHQNEIEQREVNHIDLYQGLITKIIRFNFYYFKLRVKDHESPIQLTFFNSDDNEKLEDFKVFASLYSIFPTKFNAEYISANSKTLKISSEFKYFSETFLYLSFYSEMDVKLRIVYLFGLMEKETTANKQKKSKTIEVPNSQYCIYKLFFNKKYVSDNVEEILEKRRRKKAKLLMQKRPNTFYNQKLYEEKYKLAVQKKQENYEDKILELRSKQIIPDYIKSYRIYQEYQQTKINKINTFALIWIQMIILVEQGEKMKLIIQKEKEKQKIKRRGIIAACKLCGHYLQKIKVFGPTYECRLLFSTNISLNFYANKIEDRVEKQAGQIIEKCLNETLLTYLLVKCHTEINQRIKTVQQKFRSLKVMKTLQRERIWKLIEKNIVDTIQDLINEKQNIVETVEQRKKRPKNKLFGHVFTVDQTLMNLLIDGYIQRTREKWNIYVQKTILQKDKKQRLIDFALYFKVPKLYDIPKDHQIKELIKQYAIEKKYI